MNELFGGYAGLPNPYFLGKVSLPEDDLQRFFSHVSSQVITGQSIFDESEEDYYRKYLVVGGPGYVETQEGNKALLWRELEKHIGSIDSELLRLIKEWYPTTRSVLTFLTSVGAYPSKTKIKALKEALTAPDRHSDQGFMRITKILLGKVRRSPRGIYELAVYPPIVNWDKDDPLDPDAEGVSRKGIGFEIKRRQRWRKEWEDYLADLKQRSGLSFRFEFLCDLPSDQYALITISPYLRLPSGDYLAPNGEIVKPPAISSGHVKPIAEDNRDEKKEEKKEEKKFPWWFVIVIGVVALFFFMKD